MQSANRPKKLPRNYRLVLDVVRDQPMGVHAAASDIYAEARRRQAGIGSSTVYRALDRLCDHGLLHSVRVPGTSSTLYEAARSNHAHFLCTACGAVADVDYEVPPSDIATLTRTLGIAIAEVSLTFNGRCAACEAAAAH